MTHDIFNPMSGDVLGGAARKAPSQNEPMCAENRLSLNSRTEQVVPYPIAEAERRVVEAAECWYDNLSSYHAACDVLDNAVEQLRKLRERKP